MQINHNIAALNTYRQLSMNQTAGNKSLEKLSSGLRINRAGDDAAGLAISEKMRGQVRGLNQASANAQDAISMIQTAEGALTETHAILQRMRELAVQSASDTNVSSDRSAIQQEIQQLKSEIDRIGNTTEFNTQKLIDGSIGIKRAPGVDNAAIISDQLGKATSAKLTGTVNFNAGAAKIADATIAIDTATQSITVDGAKIDFKVTLAELQATAGDTTGVAFANLLQTKINEGIDTYNQTYGKDLDHVSVTAATDKITVTSGSTGATSSVAITTSATGANNLWEIAGYGVAVTTLTDSGINGAFTTAGAANWSAVAAGDTSTVTVDGVAIKVTWANVGAQAAVADDDMSGANFAGKLQTDINTAITAYNATVPASESISHVKVTVQDGSFVIQSGSDQATSSIKFDDSEAAQLLGVAGQSSATQGGGVKFQIGANQTQNMQVTIEDMRSEALNVANIDLSTREGAEEGITTIDAAITKVSSQRSELGAFQNRLEHTIKNLNVSGENLQTAESRIRDVDMAKEMMEFTKNNILAQAATAMLAQANQQPQMVLQLLR